MSTKTPGIPGLPPPVSQLNRGVLNLVGPDRKEPRRYNPSRDVAYAFPQLIHSVLQNLSHDKDPRFREFARRSGLSERALADTVLAFSRFVAEVVGGHSGRKTPVETAVTSGLATTDVVAEYALMARIGMVFCAFFHDFFNDAFLHGNPILTEDMVKRMADKFLESVYQTAQLTPPGKEAGRDG